MAPGHCKNCKSLREKEAAQIFMLISKYLNFKHNTQIYFPIEEFYDRNNRSCLFSEQCWRKVLLDDLYRRWKSAIVLTVWWENLTQSFQFQKIVILVFCQSKISLYFGRRYERSSLLSLKQIFNASLIFPEHHSKLQEVLAMMRRVSLKLWNLDNADLV